MAARYCAVQCTYVCGAQMTYYGASQGLHTLAWHYLPVISRAVLFGWRRGCRCSLRALKFMPCMQQYSIREFVV